MENKHIYYGVEWKNELCKKCGKHSRHINHYMNALIVCDTLDGPCACGAWHKKDDARYYNLIMNG